MQIEEKIRFSRARANSLQLETDDRQKNKLFPGYVED